MNAHKPIERRRCPHCNTPIEAAEWKATLVRSGKVLEGGIVVDRDPGDPNAVFSVPPGTYIAHPCGHSLEPEFGQSVLEDYARNAHQENAR